MDAAHYGNLAGASDIVFHPGSYFGLTAVEVLPLAIERLSACIDELRAANNPVTLRPETMGKTAMLGSMNDTLEMSKAIKGVEPCIDFAHLHARAGDGSMNSKAEWLAILDGYAQFRRRCSFPTAYPPFRYRVWCERRAESCAYGRIGFQADGPFGGAARTELFRSHPLRISCNGRGRALNKKHWEELVS
jgi:hypothetical protein